MSFNKMRKFCVVYKIPNCDETIYSSRTPMKISKRSLFMARRTGRSGSPAASTGLGQVECSSWRRAQLKPALAIAICGKKWTRDIGKYLAGRYRSLDMVQMIRH